VSKIGSVALIFIECSSTALLNKSDYNNRFGKTDFLEAVWQNISSILQELILASQFGSYFRQLQEVFRNPLISGGNGPTKKKSAPLPIVLLDEAANAAEKALAA